MPWRPQLILDVAGVLISNFSPMLWEEMAALGVGMTAAELRSRFKAELRVQLWTGAVVDTVFFDWVSSQVPAISPQAADRLLRHWLTPLPAMDRLPHWSQSADLHLLSNHRSEWIVPIVDSASKFITSMTISSEVGLCKPDPRMYRIVYDKLAAGAPVYYIDDQQKNLAPAEAMGWRTILADSEGLWMNRVENLLRGGAMAGEG